MRKGMLAIGLLAGALLAWGCGGEAAQGDECGESGADGECEAGSVCGKHTDGDELLICLKVCTDDTQCAADEQCNGVEGTNVKGCRIKTQ